MHYTLENDDIIYVEMLNMKRDILHFKLFCNITATIFVEIEHSARDKRAHFGGKKVCSFKCSKYKKAFLTDCEKLFYISTHTKLTYMQLIVQSTHPREQDSWVDNPRACPTKAGRPSRPWTCRGSVSWGRPLTSPCSPRGRSISWVPEQSRRAGARISHQPELDRTGLPWRWRRAEDGIAMTNQRGRRRHHKKEGFILK